MNSVNIIGRLTKEIELRYISTNNTAVVSFTIAVDDGFGDKKKTYFINCQAWAKTAENISTFFSKGDLIGVSGKLATRSWDDNEGKKHYVTEIVVNEFSFCNGKKSDRPQAQSEQHNYGFYPDVQDDELPF